MEMLLEVFIILTVINLNLALIIWGYREYKRNIMLQHFEPIASKYANLIGQGLNYFNDYLKEEKEKLTKKVEHKKKED